jgi:hypothetical protein
MRQTPSATQLAFPGLLALAAGFHAVGLRFGNVAGALVANPFQLVDLLRRFAVRCPRSETQGQ